MEGYLFISPNKIRKLTQSVGLGGEDSLTLSNLLGS